MKKIRRFLFFFTSKILIIENISLLTPHKIKIIKNRIRHKNPDIFDFNKISRFIYQPTYCNYYIHKLKDYNKIKPDSDEFSFLNDLIKSLNDKNNNDEILVLPFFKLLLENVKIIEPQLDERALIIRDIINSWPKDSTISLSKIEAQFGKIAIIKKIKPIKKTYIHYIMKKILKYRFKKIMVKTNKLLEKNYIQFSFLFLKILIKSLNIGLKPIFIDECGFFLKNQNFRNWCESKGEYYSKLGDNTKKLNLVMAVTNERVLHYKISENNTNTESFLVFMKELLSKIDEKERKEFIFIMDNLSVHLSLPLFQFYYNNNLKILFCVPYNSMFNMIEKVFRFLKNYTYKRIYQNIKSLKDDIINLIENKSLKENLPKLFCETLNIYKDFLIKYNKLNLNK